MNISPHIQAMDALARRLNDHVGERVPAIPRGKLSPSERLERKRARDRERINRLRADPAYRAAENVQEIARYHKRLRSDPAHRAREHARWKRRYAETKARIAGEVTQ